MKTGHQKIKQAEITSRAEYQQARDQSGPRDDNGESNKNVGP